MQSHEALLKPREVCSILRVSDKTLRKYAKAGHLKAVRLPSGHFRYAQGEVENILAGCPPAGAENVASPVY